MATAYYSQSAASNYYAASAGHSHHSSSSHKSSRGYRVCDQCQAVETPSVPRFRLCGGCMTTQYCSTECQKAHWPGHKQICQHTAQQLSGAKQSNTASAYPDENVTKYLRKFCSQHCDLLGWAAFQALQLKRMPANIRQNALLVDLTYTNADSHRRFSVNGTHIVPRTYIQDPLVIADIQRREERCRQAGGIGTAVVLIQCGSVSQVMPVEVDSPSKIDWATVDEWASVLHQYVDSGRGDFKPKPSRR